MSLPAAGAALAAAVAAAAGGALVLVAAGASVLQVGASAREAGAAASGPVAGIPTAYLADFRAAAATCPGLPWSVLAGIGRVETDFGADDRTSPAGAVGPMQFLPATFAAYARPAPAGGPDPPSPLDPADAVYAAARLLCASGARNGADVAGAVFAYNHSRAYVAAVLAYARGYSARAEATAVGAPGRAAAEAVDYAVAQIGTPYRWGGETPGVGFDCSGLTQAAYASAGVAIPRTSEAQWIDLPHVALDDLRPGDLLFFEPGEFAPGLPGHVGVYIGAGEMVDAPHAGADVRIDDLAAWPPPMGAARPAALTGSAAAGT